MEKVRIRKIIEDIIITQFLNSEIDIVHEEDVSFKELGLDSVDRIELDVMVEQKFNIVIIDYDMETIKDIEAQIKKAEAEKIKRRAEAAAHLAKAEAEAKAIQMKLEAEAEGKKKSLMAEADGFKAMVEAAESNPQIAIQYKMVNQWKEIAGEQVKAFEHINLGNITVFDGGQNSTGNFLNNVVKTVAPALGVIDQLPIADTLKKLKGDDKKINTMAQGYTWA